MISVLTLTYRRRFLLEEAVESYLRQDFDGESEMLIINDCSQVEYRLEHPKIRIINVSPRFPSVGQKLRFGFAHSRYEHIFRLDDDDLLTPWALRHTWNDIQSCPDFEIYRSNGHYLFESNVYKGISGNVNNGNVYTKKYLSRIGIPDSSFGEDYAITFGFDAKIYVSPREQKTMIYRWGMSTYHVSGAGNIGNEAISALTDQIVADSAKERGAEPDEGVVLLRPHFDEEYYEKLP